jgi:hypothetical protein
MAEPNRAMRKAMAASHLPENNSPNNLPFKDEDGRKSPPPKPKAGPNAMTDKEADFDAKFRALVKIAMGDSNKSRTCADFKKNLATTDGKAGVISTVSSWKVSVTAPSMKKWKTKMSKEMHDRKGQRRQQWAVGAIAESEVAKDEVKKGVK